MRSRLSFLRLKLTLGLLAGLLLLAPSANSHLLQLSDSEIVADGALVVWTFQIHLGDFDRFFRGATDEVVASFFANRARLTMGGKPCRRETVTQSRDLKREVHVIRATFLCPQVEEPLVVDYQMFFGDPSHRHLLKAKAFQQDFSHTFSPDRTQASFASGGKPQTFQSFLLLGLEHILIGYDHILFVLTLILGARSLGKLFWLVTSFTLAHSMTLALGAFGILSLPPQFVEPLIAASIVLLAILDWRARGEGPFRTMLFLTFAFGLVHGMGFSYILQEANLQRGQLVLPLLSFNLGVEAGQIAIVLLVYPLLRLLERFSAKAYLVTKKVALVAIGTMGLYWLISRLPFWQA